MLNAVLGLGPFIKVLFVKACFAQYMTERLRTNRP